MRASGMMAGLIIACAVAAVAVQDVIYLKTGSSYVGTLTGMSEKDVTLKTEKGTLTFPWTSLDTEKTIKRYNETLYRQIKGEEFRKKGYVEYKGKWMSPALKEKLEMEDKGYAKFEGKWLPTNEVAVITQTRAAEQFRKQQEARGMKEYKGKWYSEEDLAEVQQAEKNKGIKIGMTVKDVTAKWGEPTRKKASDSFKAQQMEMWFYVHESENTEDRVLFKFDKVSEVKVGQEITPSDE